MATDTSMNTSRVQQQTQAFLTFLREKFNDEEAHAFYETFALTMQGKNDEFCIDLDEAFPWLGYTRKDNAIRLMIQTLKMKKNIDYALLTSEEDRKGEKHMLKPASFKKLLLAARTEKAKQAAEYFIKIEEAIPEFYRRNNEAHDLERRIRHRNLAIEQFTQVYDPEKNPIVSAGYPDTMQDPQVYIGIVKNMRFVEGSIPEGACVLSFGHTGSAAERLRDHQQKNGDYTYIDHLPCAASYELEQEIKRHLTVVGRLKVGRRLNDSKDYEIFWVYDQADYDRLVSQFWEKRQKMMDAICDMHGRTMDLAIAKEKTRQVVAQAHAEGEARTAEANARKAEAEADARKAEAEARKVVADSAARRAEADARKADCELESKRVDAEARRIDFQIRKLELEERKAKMQNEIVNAAVTGSVVRDLVQNSDGHDSSHKNEDSLSSNQDEEVDSHISIERSEEVSKESEKPVLLQQLEKVDNHISTERLEDILSTEPGDREDNSLQISEASSSHDTGPTSTSVARTSVDMFAEYTREKKVKKPLLVKVAETRQRTSLANVEQLSAEKQETVDTFISECCELGVDQKPIRDLATQHFFEPQTSLHSVYCMFTEHHRGPPKTAVKYADFVKGLAARGVVQEHRTYPVRRTTGNGKTNRPLISFVGIRLKNRPSSDLERDVTAFINGYTEVAQREDDVPTTTISKLFKLFDAKFPGWTAYYVNQCLLDFGYRIDTHRSKGERAWVNLLLIPEGKVVGS